MQVYENGGGMNMKKPAVILLVCLMVILTACGDGKKADDAKAPAASVDIPAYTVNKVLDTMGDELVQKAKDAGFVLKVNFKNYTPVASQEELKGAPDVMKISIYLNSAAGTANPDAITLDAELMKQIQYAILDADVFGLTDDEKNTLKSDWFKEGDYTGLIDIEEKHVRLEIKHQGSGKNRYAQVSIGHWGNIPDFYNDTWYVNYTWDEITDTTLAR